MYHAHRGALIPGYWFDRSLLARELGLSDTHLVGCFRVLARPPARLRAPARARSLVPTMGPRGVVAVAALAVALSLTTAIGASAFAYSWYRAASRSDVELQALRYEMTQRRLQQVARHHQCAPCPACEYHSPAPGAVNAVEVTDNDLFVRTNVLHLDGQRHMQLPPNFTYIVEIGASDRNTLDQELLPRRPDLFLITLEPVIDKYARALARYSW